MVTPDWDAIDAEVTAAKTYGERQSFRTVLYHDQGAQCPILNKMEACEDIEC